jgi:CheY-like chemotaxis protein
LLFKARFIINEEVLKFGKQGITVSIFDKNSENAISVLTKNDNQGITHSKFDDVSDDIAVVLTDYDMFGVIIRKLIQNAIIYTNSGRIEVGYKIESGKNIKFYIKDTGIGIPKDKQGIIFDFFRQVEESSTRKFGGMGSGLAICNSFIEKMNGEIWVESIEGEGSTFYFSLPLVDARPTKNIERTVDYDDDDISLKGKTILIVDDIEPNRQYLDCILQDEGSIILSAENGADAVELVKNKNNIDVILMDLNMPVMDGYEATRIIKLLHPEIPIIWQTAYSFSMNKESAFEKGCNAFLIKPIKADELIITIKECLLYNYGKAKKTISY